MHQFLLSLDEVDRVKRLNGIHTTSELAAAIGIHRNTVSRVLATRKASERVLDGFATIGARADRILVAAES